MKKLFIVMMLMASAAGAALEKTWYTSPNNTLDSTSITTVSKNSLWMMYAALTGVSSVWANGTLPVTGLWTVWCSSDGTGTAGVPHLPTDDCTTSHNDGWTSTYTAANLVRNAAGSHSWMVLKSANTGGFPTIYMLIDWNTASDQTVTLSWSMTVMKCVANPCTATTAPTAADKWSETYTTNVASIASQNRLHFSVDQDGSFWFQETRDGNGWGIITPLVGVWLKDTKVVDTIPFVTSVYVPGTSTAAPVVQSWGEDAHAGGSGLDGRTITNGGASKMVTIGQSWFRTASGVLVNIFAGGTGGISGVDGIDGKWDDFPLYVLDTTSTGLRGRLPDFRTSPYTVASGAVAPSPGPFTNIAYPGSVNAYTGAWFPYSNVSTPIF